MAGLLEGITVIELAEGWTGAAICGRMLADLGAEVIKVESPQGDPLRKRPPFLNGESIAFAFAAAGKRSVAIGPRSPHRATCLDHLIARADIVLDGYGPGRDELVGLDEPDLRRKHPGLIYCLVSTFGCTGALREWIGSDLLAQAASGLMASTGVAGGSPTRVGIPVGEHAAALFATTAIAAALIHRRATGRGQTIDIAARDCLFSFHSSYLPRVFLEGVAPTRMGFRHPMISPWDAYEARDGLLIVCTGTDAHWQEILRVIGRTDLADDPAYATPAQRVRNADGVQELIEAWTRRHSVAEAVSALEAIGVPAGPSLDLPEVLAHPQLLTRDMLVNAKDVDGRTIVASGSLFKLSGTPGQVRRAAPRLGEDGVGQLAGSPEVQRRRAIP
jgi:CoA:oxalate CoA-transferase